MKQFRRELKGKTENNIKKPEGSNRYQECLPTSQRVNEE